MSSRWRLQEGLTPGTRDYVSSSRIADGFDSFLAGDNLAEFDARLLKQLFPGPADAMETVVDFGAGTGRCLLPIVDRGYCGLAVDLSGPMLEQLHTKLAQPEYETVKLHLLQANLVNPDAICDAVADHGICMFSTLGMINSREHRHSFLVHARRIIKSGGNFVIHAHNVWNQVRGSGGVTTLLKSLPEVLRGRRQFGDRYADYRGIRGMFIHSFGARELERDLAAAGWSCRQWYKVPGAGSETNATDVPEHRRGRFDSKTVGWIVVCD